MKEVFKLDFRGRELVIEIGEIAKQASSSCLVRYGDTVVLSTATASDKPRDKWWRFLSTYGTLSRKTIFSRKNSWRIY